jgi:hypothetical protein
MVRALIDEPIIEATIAESGHERQWRAACGKQTELGQPRSAARTRWKDNGEFFLAIRHRNSDGTTKTELLSAPATPDGQLEIIAAADALEVEFARQLGFERLLAALKAPTIPV